MRHLLLALLIALLPLRGWVGDAMATQMSAGQIQHSQSEEHGQQHGATKTIAEHQDHTLAEAHFDHEDMAQAQPAAEPDCAGHGTGESTHTADGHCESCAACQACNTVALSLTGPDLCPVFKSLALPLPAADHFASADAALRQKPPIS
ncbi:MAG: hypothetical protein O9327_17085 [Polaromonas sp.]|nr:hypothetical protein [Polaromonas sp.]